MTSIETGPSWSERLNPRNWTLAWKLLIVGLVPALLALALGALRIADQAGSAAEIGDSTRLVEVRAQVATAADTLRQERDRAVLFVAANRGDTAPLAQGIGQTDAAVQSMYTALDTVGRSADITAARAAAQDDTATLQQLRTDTTGTATSTQVRDGYTAVIGQVDLLDRTLLRQLRIPETAGLADALTALTGAREQLSLQHTALGAAIRSSQLQPGDAGLSAAAEAQLVALDRDYRSAVSPEQLTQFGDFRDDPSSATRQQLANTIVTTPADRPITLAPGEWDTAFTASLAAVTRANDGAVAQLSAAGAAAERTAQNQAGYNTVFLMLGLLIGITIALLVARSLIRSLRVLRSSALDVAERRLPQAVESMRAGEVPDVTVDPVPIDSRDEVGQVARAFDAVHGQAVRLAADQASLQSNVSAMFVNLSRRSQALVERQLQLIEQLESNEQDADQLSNLFQLDHLATRMRRNSENLLVLAGTDLAKRNIAPVPMVDVLRAAVSEIEQYQRIVVQAPPSATIVGRAGSDLVHLLAELLDNATNFSPPDSQVVMSTTRTSDGSMLVEIADRGVGMIDHELSDANQRLGGPSTVDVSASRRMGLFVVGRLGARHGIGVRLSTSAVGGPGAGLTASVTVPAYLIPAAEPVEPARPIGVPQPAGVPAQNSRGDQGGRGEVPPQRGTNGSGRNGSLSAFVAGADGPPNPAGVLDGPAGPLFGTPPSNGSTNGSHGGPPGAGANGLPNRRPGSSMRPEGPPPTERGDGPVAGDRAPDPVAAAREVAEQARRDQEAAERAERARSAGRRDRPAPGAEPVDRPDADPADDRRGRQAAGGSDTTGSDTGSDTGHDDTGRDDTTAAESAVDAPADAPAPEGAGTSPAADAARPNGSQAYLAPAPFGNGRPPGREAAADASSESGTESGDDRAETRDEPAAGATPHAEEERTQRPDPQRVDSRRPDSRRPDLPQRPERAGPEQPRPGPAADPGFGSGAAPASPGGGATAAPRPVVPPSPPTTPMPVVGRQGPANPAPRPAAGPPARPNPQQQQPPVGPAQPPSAPQPVGRSALDRPSTERPARPGGWTPPTPVDRSAEWTPPQPSGPQPSGLQSSGLQPSGPQASGPRPPAPGRRPDELFAPSVPNIAGLGLGRGREDADGRSGFELGETTPIFEEIASAWFRSNRPVPVTWETDEDGTPRPPQEGAAPERADVPRAPRPAAAPTPAPRPVVAPEADPEPEQAPVPAGARGFANSADEGWRAANGVEADRPDELTAAGLPKRRPRARLVPGSAGSAVLSPPVTASRSAETIRGRLASYQQGVRQGRETRARGESSTATDTGTNPADAGGTDNEELS